MSDTQTIASAEMPADPALAADGPLAQQLAAALVALDDAASAVHVESDAKYDRMISALAPFADEPETVQAIRGFEIARDAARKSARDARAAQIRAAFPEMFRLMSLYGLPEAVKPVPTAKSNGSKRPTDVTTLDGVLYVKSQDLLTTYVRTNVAPCGTCLASANAVQSPAHAGTDAIQLPNYRQNATRAVEKMSHPEIIAHADCFNAMRDGEASYPQTATVTRYSPAQ